MKIYRVSTKIQIDDKVEDYGTPQYFQTEVKAVEYASRAGVVDILPNSLGAAYVSDWIDNNVTGEKYRYVNNVVVETLG